MSLDLQFEEVYTAEEIATALKITDEGLLDLESEGLPFIQTESGHVYLTSSILTFFRKMEKAMDEV
jgi:hypothetical protein